MIIHYVKFLFSPRFPSYRKLQQKAALNLILFISAKSSIRNMHPKNFPYSQLPPSLPSSPLRPFALLQLYPTVRSKLPTRNAWCRETYPRELLWRAQAVRHVPFSIPVCPSPQNFLKLTLDYKRCISLCWSWVFF